MTQFDVVFEGQRECRVITERAQVLGGGVIVGGNQDEASKWADTYKIRGSF